MPRQKIPSAVLSRDTDFTKTIGNATTGKPDPYALAAERVKQSHSDNTKASVSNKADLEDVPENTVGSGRDTEVKTSLASNEKPETRKSDSTLSKKAAAKDDQDDIVAMVIQFSLPTDVVIRTEKWCKAIGVPIRLAIRQSFSKMKPSLLADLKTLTSNEIDTERAESVGLRVQSRLRFSQAEFASLSSRLDPADLGIISPMIAKHARDRFTTFLDTMLADAGY